MPEATPAPSAAAGPRLNWRHELLLVLVSAAQTCLLLAWLTVPTNPLAALHPLDLIRYTLSVFLVAAYAVRLMGWLGLSDSRRLVVALIGIVATLVWGLTALLYPGRTIGEALSSVGAHLTDVKSTVLGDVSIIVLAVVAWWVGQENGRSAFAVDSLRASLRRGILLLGAYMLLVSLFTHEVPVGYFAGYFACMLLALALARSGELMQHRLAGRAPFGRRWLAFISAMTFGFVGAGLLIWSAIGPPLIEALWLAVRAVQYAVLLILILVGAIAGQLFGRGDISPPAAPPAVVLTPVVETDAVSPAATGAPLPGVGFQIANLLPTVVLTGLALLILLAARRASRQHTSRHVGGPVIASEEDSAIVEEPRPGRRTSPGDALRRRFGRYPRWLAARTIRRFYAQTLALAADCGAVRPASATPYDFLPTLTSVLAGVESDLVVVTDAYVRAHYGQVPDTPERLDAVHSAFDRIRAEASAVIAYNRQEARRHQRLLKENVKARLRGDALPSRAKE